MESSESREEVDALMHEGSYEEVDETLAYGNYGRRPLKAQFRSWGIGTGILFS